MTKKLIVVADLGSFKAYRVTSDGLSQSPRVDLIQEHRSELAHERIVDQVTDMAGRFQSANGVSATGENHNLRSENQRRLVRQLASRISRLVSEESPDQWFFSAAKEVNHKIVEELDPAVRARMTKNVAADLVKIHKSELLAHF